MTLDNREWALLFWLALVLLGLLSKRNFRASLGGVLRAALRPVILLPFAAMLAYVALEVWIGSKVALWQADLLKGTIIWVMASGLVMVFNYNKAAEVQFFRNTIRGTVGTTVFVEFFMNVVAFSLLWEIAYATCAGDPHLALPFH
jgi:hypothetical protein